MASNPTVNRTRVVEARNLLEAPGYDVEDYPVTRRPDAETFDLHRDSADSSLLFVDDEAIGDRDDLMRWLARNAH